MSERTIPELDEEDLKYLKIDVNSRLGGGAFGRVYRCEYRGQILAIKVMHPRLSKKEEKLNAFIKEAWMTYKCPHNNIVATHAICRVPPAFCSLPTRCYTWAILMDLMEKGSLSDVIRLQKLQGTQANASKAGKRLSEIGQAGVRLSETGKAGMRLSEIGQAGARLSETGQTRSRLSETGLARSRLSESSLDPIHKLPGHSISGKARAAVAQSVSSPLGKVSEMFAPKPSGISVSGRLSDRRVTRSPGLSVSGRMSDNNVLRSQYYSNSRRASEVHGAVNVGKGGSGLAGKTGNRDSYGRANSSSSQAGNLQMSGKSVNMENYSLANSSSSQAGNLLMSGKAGIMENCGLVNRVNSSSGHGTRLISPGSSFVSQGTSCIGQLHSGKSSVNPDSSSGLSYRGKPDIGHTKSGLSGSKQGGTEPGGGGGGGDSDNGEEASNYSDLDALSWIMDIARALEFLHSQDPPVVHRDVKPDNILLCHAPVDPSIEPPAGLGLMAKLSDFGIHVVLNNSRALSSAGSFRAGSKVNLLPLSCLPGTELNSIPLPSVRQSLESNLKPRLSEESFLVGQTDQSEGSLQVSPPPPLPLVASLHSAFSKANLLAAAGRPRQGSMSGSSPSLSSLAESPQAGLLARARSRQASMHNAHGSSPSLSTLPVSPKVGLLARAHSRHASMSNAHGSCQSLAALSLSSQSSSPSAAACPKRGSMSDVSASSQSLATLPKSPQPCLLAAGRSRQSSMSDVSGSSQPQAASGHLRQGPVSDVPPRASLLAAGQSRHGSMSDVSRSSQSLVSLASSTTSSGAPIPERSHPTTFNHPPATSSGTPLPEHSHPTTCNHHPTTMKHGPPSSQASSLRLSSGPHSSHAASLQAAFNQASSLSAAGCPRQGLMTDLSGSSQPQGTLPLSPQASSLSAAGCPRQGLMTDLSGSSQPQGTLPQSRSDQSLVSLASSSKSSGIPIPEHSQPLSTTYMQGLQRAHTVKLPSPLKPKTASPRVLPSAQDVAASTLCQDSDSLGVLPSGLDVPVSSLCQNRASHSGLDVPVSTLSPMNPNCRSVRLSPRALDVNSSKVLNPNSLSARLLPMAHDVNSSKALEDFLSNAPPSICAKRLSKGIDGLSFRRLQSKLSEGMVESTSVASLRSSGDWGSRSSYDVPDNQGTYLYMAPERVNMELCDEKSDVFSLGMVMLLITAQPQRALGSCGLRKPVNEVALIDTQPLIRLSDIDDALSSSLVYGFDIGGACSTTLQPGPDFGDASCPTPSTGNTSTTPLEILATCGSALHPAGTNCTAPNSHGTHGTAHAPLEEVMTTWAQALLEEVTTTRAQANWQASR
eukprot:gene31333-6482_t